jgi:hypothetical protein
MHVIVGTRVIIIRDQLGQFLCWLKSRAVCVSINLTLH